MHVNNFKPQNNNSGFTLVEVVFGIILFSVAMVTIVSVIMPQTQKAIDPLWQVRGISLGESLLSEISSKAFDESSIASGGRRACGSASVICTASGSFGPEGDEERVSFDDIDDYHGLILDGEAISNATAQLGVLFTGFQARITVFYDQNADGIDDDIANTGTLTADTKLISIIIVTPGGEEIPFAIFRKNV
jgi:MSHA pilin protein MshD